MSEQRDVDARVARAKSKLTSDWGRAQLEQNLAAGFRRVLATPVGELFEVDAVTRAIEAFSSDPFLSDAVRPAVRTLVMLEMARLREDPTKLGEYVSPEARALVDELLSRKNLLPEKFIKKMGSHAAFEEIARDVLEDAIREFSEKVDPFKAEWGLPSLLKGGGPFSIGLGAFAKGFETVRQEVEKRVVPERKRFLQAFARRAIETVADNIVKRSDEPQFVALRKELFAWLLEQPVSELVATQSEPVTELSNKIGHELARYASTLESTKRRRRALVEMMIKAHEKQPLEAALAVYGAKLAPDFAAITGLIWPFLKAGLEAPEVDAFLGDLLAD